MNFSPIVLFVYNRPWHTKQTVEALQKNDFACESELFIYSDGAKTEKDIEKVIEVRDYIKTISGFKSITIIERDKNWGLADSIIDGVTEIVNKYGRIIVLEDDIVTSKYFLKFMNESLEFYEKEIKVWHISGWNYPIKNKCPNDVFFWRLMNCWGWATWKDRWAFFNKDINKIFESFSKSDIRKFDLENTGVFWNQVLMNSKRKINTWAIFWYASIFMNNGLCLNPCISFVKNIGLDNSGTNCTKNKSLDIDILNQNSSFSFNCNIEENAIAVQEIIKFYKLNNSFVNRICNFIKANYL
ncbi:MAG: glycosyltransferase [Candidatus Delongbacteria bacterium]|nr:glycosyltransferase [Candidatus Delongbacteria bacterium]